MPCWAHTSDMTIMPLLSAIEKIETVMTKLVLIINLIVFTFLSLKGQKYENLSVASKKQSQSELSSIIKELTSLDTMNFTVKKMNWYHHLLSSSYMWLGEKEKAKYHLFKALKTDSDFMCHFTRMNIKRDIPEAHYLESVPKDTYFAYHFDSETQDEFFSYCEICCNGGVRSKKIDSLPYNGMDSIFIRLKENDQKFRGPNSIGDMQEDMDAQNRITLDSIFTNIGFPNKYKVNSESINTVWLIIHHSTDCEWTGKWLSRALYEIENGNLSLGFYRETIKRFYNRKDGYCLGEEKFLISNELVKNIVTGNEIKVDNRVDGPTSDH